MEETKKTKDERAETEEKTVASENAPKSDAKKGKKPEHEAKALKAELEAKEKALAEAEDKYLRLFAEYDNFRAELCAGKRGLQADAG